MLLLPALIALGGATDACIQAFCHHLHFPLQEVTGHGLNHVQGLDSIMTWAWTNPGCVVISFMLPWWIGAWALVRPESAPSLLSFSQVVLGVLSTAVAQLAFFLWCAADLVRELQLWSHAYNGYAIWIFLAALVIVVTLVVVKGSKLAGK
ncbi:MAG TPA: hypothetical protein VLE43_09360 [Candidatus Saccharimonadia bacterium]|nr:hypothetical protein [Candidatus Saccharimonadia bacterium]